MITKYTISENTTMFGLSTDSKPTDSGIINGSAFIEMDTSKIYFYDSANSTWREWEV